LSHLSKNKKPGPSLWKIPWDDGEDDSESSEPESDVTTYIYITKKKLPPSSDIFLSNFLLVLKKTEE
jgi:hypothetical protein